MIADSYSVHMYNGDVDIVQNQEVKEKYPKLYEEVRRHNEVLNSNWYNLSKAAHIQYQQYMRDKAAAANVANKQKR